MPDKNLFRLTDQTGRDVLIPERPERIISLVPSQTELLAYLQLEKEVSGITRFCIYPEKWYRTKQRVGGTKKLDLDRIRSINPDLILGNKEENSREEIEKLREEFPVWLSEINCLDEALDMIRSVGVITNRRERSEKLVGEISRKFELIRKPRREIRIVYLIWKDPWMAAGAGTFIHDMISRCGLVNAFRNHSRYPVITAEDIRSAKPDYIFFSTEPYPFKVTDFTDLTGYERPARCVIVNGELFSWYGSRLLETPDYLNELSGSLS